MANTIERGEVFGLSDEAIAKMRARFAEECKRLLEGLAGQSECTCGVGTKSAVGHPLDCPIAIWHEAAHAVWMWGQP